MSQLSFVVDDVKKAKAGGVLSSDTLTTEALPCLSWCHTFLAYASNEEAIAGAFRSRQLADAAQKVFPDSCHTRFSPSLVAAFDEFRRLREKLRPVSGLTIGRVANELRRPGSLLVTDWAASLFDGALTPDTHGFMNDDGMPPWDTWLALVDVPNVQGPACLLSWVPYWLSERIDLAIQVDAAESLSWLFIEDNLTFMLNGWGQSVRSRPTGLKMKAILHGGPYDGIILDHHDINLYTQFMPIGIRQFVAMPPPKDWDAVRRGDKDKGGPFDEACLGYELIRTPFGVEGRFDSDGSILADALQEFREGKQVVPNADFTGQYFKCYRGDLHDVALPDDHFVVTDEKGREWHCFAVSKEEGETGGFAEMVSRLGGKPSTQPLRLVILLCNDQSELVAKLADQID